jgi:carbonic anhydrase/acetyltransferase-like protein (isoleucine patch superfamily)
MIRGYLDKFPQMGNGVFIEESAQIIGDVEIGDHSSVWFNTVLRGDVYYIRIGKCSNIQDGCILHVTRDRFATVVGDYVTVAHGVILHGCKVESHCLIGMGAIVMDQVVIGEGSIVGAGALLTTGLQVPPQSLVLGSPARVIRELSLAEVQGIDRYARNYLMYKENYLKGKEAGS